MKKQKEEKRVKHPLTSKPLIEEGYWIDKNEVVYSANKKKLTYAQGCITQSYQVRKGTIVIGDYAFSECAYIDKTYYDYVTQNINFSKGIFEDCKNLKAISLPDSVTTIGEHAFFKCYALTSIVLPNSVEHIGYGVFAFCHELTSIVLPEGVKSMGKDVFIACEKLETINILCSGQTNEEEVMKQFKEMLSEDLHDKLKIIRTMPEKTLAQALPYEEGMSFRKYLLLNAENIKNFEQHPFKWKKKDGELQRSLVLACENKSFREQLPTEEKIDREIVDKAWERGLYEGFVATLLWGGYHKGLSKSHLPKVAAIPPKEIEEKLARVKGLLERGCIKEAATSMCDKQENYIYGMKFSFFSKFLYFLGRDMKNFDNGIKPLIFDNQSQAMYICLLNDAGENIPNLATTNIHKAVDNYMDYIRRMKEYAEEIGTTSEQLEAFLFTETGNRDMTNPREVIKLLANQALHA